MGREDGFGCAASGDERAMFTGHSAATHMPSRKQRCRGLVLLTMFGERRRAKWHKDWRRKAGRKRGREDRDILISRGEDGWREGWRRVSVPSKLKVCMHSYYTSCNEDKCCRRMMEILLCSAKKLPRTPSVFWRMCDNKCKFWLRRICWDLHLMRDLTLERSRLPQLSG